METLNAMPVPWMISPSVSGARVEVWELDSSSVEFNVEPQPAETLADGENRRVRFEFTTGWVRVVPLDFEEAVSGRARFDLSRLPLANVPADDAYLEAFDREWRRAGDCPNPGFYEVQDSAWLTETGAARWACRHYLLVFGDVWLELLTTRFAWSYLP